MIMNNYKLYHVVLKEFGVLDTEQVEYLENGISLFHTDKKTGRVTWNFYPWHRVERVFAITEEGVKNARG